VTGLANKRSAARWLAACVTSLRFESEMRRAPDGATQALKALADLQRAVGGAGLSPTDQDQIVAAIGRVGGMLEADGRILAQVVRSPAPVPARLRVLLRLAAGETGPAGPCAERARAEALKLLRAPEVRGALSAAPEAVAPIRALMKQVGLAA
jgi:hypothetical protein